MKQLFIAFLCISFSAFSEVKYNLNITNAEQHLADVSIEFPISDSNTIDVALPTWRTGRYEILNMANGLRYVRAVDEHGNALTITKKDSHTWQVTNVAGKRMSVSYQVYANELAMRSRHIDSTHAFLDASGVFMYSPSFRKEKVTVQLNVPTRWKSHSGMESGETAHSFIAPNYDVLVDSPIETGINQHYTWQVDGRDYELVVWGHGNYDTNKIINDLKKLVKTGADIWHSYPYKRYVFMVHATSGAKGATEHLNSTIIQRQRDSFATREDYLAFITTAAHEFVHTWNVKAYRPKPMHHYDYQNINFTDLLWLAEGSTSYFDNQLTLRAEIMTLKEYFKELEKSFTKHEKTPGREVQSVAATSLDKWINQGGDHAKNYSTNIYSEGALVSLALDLDLLSSTQGAKSYRDVHAALYQQHRLPNGFDAQDVKRILNELTGNDYTAWWENNVNQPVKLDFNQMLNSVGLIYDYPKNTQFKAGLEVEYSYSNGNTKLSHVKRGSSAWNAGLAAGTELVAINGQKITQSLDKFLTRFQPEQTVTISYFDNDILKTVPVELTKIAEKPKQISLIKKPTKQQKRLFKAWLGRDYPKSI